MTRYLALYRAFLAFRLKVLLEYRADLFIGVGSTLLVQAAGMAAVWVVLQRVPAVGGWGFEELLLLYGFLVASRSLEHMFADNLWVVSGYLQEGSFDRFLVRPINPLFHLLADRFHHHGVGNLLAGVWAIAHAWGALGLPVTLLTLATAVAGVLSGGVLFTSLNLATASSAFWLGHSLPVTRAVHGLHDLARYPLTIYGQGVELLLTWVVPFAFASFVPASALLGKEAGRLAWAGPPLAVAFALEAYQLWRVGLRRYTGAGT